MFDLADATHGDLLRFDTSVRGRAIWKKYTPTYISDYTVTEDDVTAHQSALIITESQISDLGNYIETETQNLEDVLSLNNSAGNKNITNLADPVNANDATTKAYVDVLLARINSLEEALSTRGTHGTFTDVRDGNVYNWVKIGEQIWMAENLAYLPFVNRIADTYVNETYPPNFHYYVYGYDGTNVNEAKATENYNTYGVLYNWTAAMNGAEYSYENPSNVRGVCPVGWHLPSTGEWNQMEIYLAENGHNFDGTTENDINSKIGISLSTGNWPNSLNAGAVGNTDYPEYRNKSGFSALPGGFFDADDSTFYDIEEAGRWWTTSVVDLVFPYCRSLHFNYYHLNRSFYGMANGLSVRCVRD